MTLVLTPYSQGCYHKTFIPKTIERKVTIHKTPGPAAPFNLKPSTSNSIGPENCSRTVTMTNAVIIAPGTPTIARG